MRTKFIVMLLNFMCATALAGTQCQEKPMTANQLREAAESVERVEAKLEQKNRKLALIMRQGANLTSHGLHYSHAGFVVRDHPDGRWSVVHLLNRCGTDQSDIHVDGLFDFFSDHLISQDVRVTWFEPEMESRLLPRLEDRSATAFHLRKYNLIARPESTKTQNSTAWVLDAIVSAQFDLPLSRGNKHIKQSLKQSGFHPDRIHVSYARRLIGGVLSANIDFTDHPIATRLSGDYPVVTVRAILRHLVRQALLTDQWEWRGQRQLSPNEIQIEIAHKQGHGMIDPKPKKWV